MSVKVIIMVSAPLTNRWASQFCTDELSKNFDLEYWNCASVAYPTFKGEALDRDYVRTPKTFVEFKQMLKTLPNDTLIVSDIHLVKQNYNFHKLVSHYFKNRIYVNFWSNAPSKMDEPRTAQIETPKKKTLKQIIYKVGWLQVLIKFIRYAGDERFKQFYAIHKHIRESKKFEQEEKDCETLYANHVITCLPHNQYSINHPDYEKYLQIKDGKRFIEKPYIVFIDEYYPYHPDFLEINSEIDCDWLAGIYYPSMNRIFDVMEKQTGMPVVIAAHPISDYSTNPYNGREIIMYKTAELVRDSSYVCMHHGFCISYVALFDKPMCFITNEGIRGCKYCYENVVANAQMMGMQLIDSDVVKETDAIFSKFPQERKDLYINRFFDLGINKRNGELLTEYLNKIYKEVAKSLKK